MTTKSPNCCCAASSPLANVPQDKLSKCDLPHVVDQLCAGNEILSRAKSKMACAEALPSRDEVIGVVESLRTVLFPGYFGDSEITTERLRYHLGHSIDAIQRVLGEQVKRGLCFACHDGRDRQQCAELASSITETFINRLPNIQRLLATDVQAAFDGDPAAHSPDETIFCYPGMLAITNLRIAHELLTLGVPLLPRMITEHAHSITGIDIHPGAQIGESFFIDHGTGVVIGETCIIGNKVRIYQGVTLGAKSFPKDKDGNPIKGIPRHPIIEDEVIIYSGATILGRITIGRGSIIGGNVWVTEDQPAGSRVMQTLPH